jgi:hypothetical protein
VRADEQERIRIDQRGENGGFHRLHADDAELGKKRVWWGWNVFSAQGSFPLGAKSDRKGSGGKVAATCYIVPVSGLTLAPWLWGPGCRAVKGSEPSRHS